MDFWDGVLAGYGIAIPVGAIAILIVETGLRRGFGPAAMAGAGAAAADFVYAALAAVAGQAVAAVLAPAAPALRLLSALVLFALGGYGLWQSRRRDQPGSRIAAAPGLGRTFFQFLGLTLLNPLTIAYFGALILGMNTQAPASAGARLAFVSGAGLASLSWQLLLAAVGALAHRRLSPRSQSLASVAGNLIVIGFGVRIVIGG